MIETKSQDDAPASDDVDESPEAEDGDEPEGPEDPDESLEPGPETVPDRAHRLRVLEALLFAATEPLDEATLAARLGGEPADLRGMLDEVVERNTGRGFVLQRMDRRWAFRTAPDLAPYLRLQEDVQRKLSRAAIETLAIIAYHQPVTRAEIESIRGVATSKGTLDLLMENSWIKPGRRRETPGRPLTWLTSDHFLDHFGLTSLRDLPGVEDLRAAGLLDPRPVLASLRSASGGNDESGPRADDEPEG